MKWIKRLLGRMGRKETLAPPPAVATITEARLAEIFLNAPNNPLWDGTLAALDLQVQEELDQTIEESLTNEQLRFRIGGVAALLKFKQALRDYEADARLTQREIEERAAQEQQQAP